MSGVPTRTIRLVTLAVLLALVGAAPSAAGDDPYDCGLLAVDEAGEARCDEDRLPGGSPAPRSCRLDVEAVFWAGSDWIRLAQALARDPLPCGDYSVSVPPLANPKTRLRELQDDAVRALGVHPLAEVNLGEATGWANWARTNGKTWFEAGVEFRRRMAAAGYQPSLGETWIVNELDHTTLRDVDRGIPNPPVPAYRRADVRQLLAGLYYGELGMEPLPGIVLLGIPFRHQNLPDVDGYRDDLRGFLADEGFWLDVDRYTRWFGVEGYADSRLWGVEGSSRAERRRHLEDYLFHVVELARSGPYAVAADVLERKFLPLGNAIYRARGGERFGFAAGGGNTILDDVQMRQFVSEQVHAIRFHAGSQPHSAPGGAIGFAWQPCNRLSADEAGCRAQDRNFVAGLDAIGARLAESIHHAYRQGGASPVGACRPPGADVDWCDGGVVAGAAFTEAWADFGKGE